jgi:hypothetical protein
MKSSWRSRERSKMSSYFFIRNTLRNHSNARCFCFSSKNQLQNKTSNSDIVYEGREEIDVDLYANSLKLFDKCSDFHMLFYTCRLFFSCSFFLLFFPLLFFSLALFFPCSFFPLPFLALFSYSFFSLPFLALFSYEVCLCRHPYDGTRGMNVRYGLVE